MSYKQAATPNTKKRPPIPVAYSGKQFKQDDIVYCNIGLDNSNSKHNSE